MSALRGDCKSPDKRWNQGRSSFLSLLSRGIHCHQNKIIRAHTFEEDTEHDRVSATLQATWRTQRSKLSLRPQGAHESLQETPEQGLLTGLWSWRSSVRIHGGLYKFSTKYCTFPPMMFFLWENDILLLLTELCRP